MDGSADRFEEAYHAGVGSATAPPPLAPRLIDLHGHPDFNVFAPWEPP